MSHKISVEEHNNRPSETSSRLSNIRYNLREYIAEYVGTIVLVTLGNSCVAYNVLQPDKSSILIPGIGFGTALAIAIFVAGPTSGGHVNPGITLANAAFRGFPWSKVPGYILAQMFGSLTSGALVYLFNSTNIQSQYSLLSPDVVGTVHPVATIFSTYPKTSNATSFCIEVFNSALMLLGIMAVNDSRHQTPRSIFPTLVGLIVMILGLAFPGYPLNPACDLGGRIFTLIAGYGTIVFTYNTYYSIVPVIAPILGALLGVFIYDTIAIPPRTPIDSTVTMA